MSLFFTFSLITRKTHRFTSASHPDCRPLLSSLRLSVFCLTQISRNPQSTHRKLACVGISRAYTSRRPNTSETSALCVFCGFLCEINSHILCENQIFNVRKACLRVNYQASSNIFHSAFPWFRLMDLFAVREEQRCRSRRAARSFAKGSAVVRERQIDCQCTNRENAL